MLSQKMNRLTNKWISLTLIGISVFIIYSNTFNSPFVFDDITSIVEKKSIRDLSNYFYLEKLLKPRAVVDLTFSINYHYGKLDVFGYHIVNILIHILNGILVYFLVITILEQQSRQAILGIQPVCNHPAHSIKTIVLFSSLLFVVHPIQTQAVTYTAQRYASMAAMFYMASLFLYLKARIVQEKEKSREQDAKIKKLDAMLNLKYSYIYTLSAFCGVLAFLSKQNTASLPGAIVLVEYLLIDRTWQGWKKKALWFFLGFGLWILFALFITGFFGDGFEGRRLLEDVSGMMRETETVSRWQYLCTQFNVLVVYIRLLFLPVNQNLDYMYPFKSGFFDSYTAFAFIFLFCIALIGIWQIKKRPVVSLGIFWFFITLSVESSIIPIGDALFEHRLYLPMFGFSLMAPYLLFDVFFKYKKFVIYFLLIIILSLGLATYQRNNIWKSVRTLWSDVVLKNPKNYRAYNNLGIGMFLKGHTIKAIEKFMQSLRIKPDFLEAHNNLGIALRNQGRFEEAIEHYVAALRANPNHPKVYNNIGVVLRKQGRFQEAIDYFIKAIKIDSDYKKAHNNLGSLLEGLGRLDEAIHHYKKVLEINQDNGNVHQYIGNIFEKQGRLQEAVSHYIEAVEFNPNNEKNHYKLANAYKNINRLDKAIEHYFYALTIKPDFEDVHNNLGNVFYQKGKIDKAIEHYREALRIRPDFVEALNNLGYALFKKGLTDEAIDKFVEAIRIKPDFEEARNNLGIALFTKGRTDDAVEHYYEALRVKPDFEDAHNNLGNALYKKGQIDEAIDHYREALRIKPNFEEALNNLGFALFTKGRTDEAIEHYREAIRIKPDYVDPYNNLAIALFRKGDIEGAVFHFRKALHLNPDHAHAKRNLNKLLRIQKK
jgi:protein O-mannosyl-transferase